MRWATMCRCWSLVNPHRCTMSTSGANYQLGLGLPLLWCGVVWCGVVWCGVVCCAVVWCGVVWRGVAWCAEGAVTKGQKAGMSTHG